MCGIFKRSIEYKVGMFDSLVIEAGTGNVGYTDMGRPVNFKITFSIVDLSELSAVPIPKPSYGPLYLNTDDESPLSRMIRTLVGSSLSRESLEQSMFVGPNVYSRVSQIIQGIQQTSNPKRIGTVLEEAVYFLRKPIADESLEQILTGRHGNYYLHCSLSATMRIV